MSIVPEINSWFTDQLDYAGYGCAEFSDPQGLAKGPVRIRVDELGKTSVEMKVEKIVPQHPHPLFFFNKPKMTKEGTEVLAIGSDSKRNMCTKLTVTTSEGNFSTHGDVPYDSRCINADTTLNFHSLLQFESKDSGNAKYWVLPLSNFLSGFAEFDTSLEHHPLRIFTFPGREELQQEERSRLMGGTLNHLILFDFANTKGFIEPLVDYEERKRKLEEGEVESLITSVMVGEIGPNSIEISDIDNWFPWDFLLLLSFATGTEVESPWIEFRDEKGNLVRRVHHRVSLPKITKNRHVILKEWVFPRTPDTGIGVLLTQVQTSESFRKTHLRVFLKYILKGGRSTRLMEERMMYLCIGLDGLCKHYKVDTQDFRNGLDSNHVSSIDMVLKKASEEILQLSNAPSLTGDSSQRDMLARIAKRTEQAPIGKDKAFGLAVVDLLNLFDLPDAAVLADYSTSVTNKWPSTLSL